MPKEEPKPVRGISSDVPSDAIKHAREVHQWAAAHPEWKRQHVEDKPKIKNRCGGCAAFQTPFCPWEYKNMEDSSAYAVHSEDCACSHYFPRLVRKMERGFEEAVENL